MGQKWRLLDVSEPDPRMNLAIDEAILRSRHQNTCPDTLRFWQNTKAVVLGNTGSIHDVNLNTCQKNGVVVTRMVSLGQTLYHDLGNLNFTVIVDEKTYKLPKNLLDTYKLMCEVIASMIRRLGMKTSIYPPGPSVYIGGKLVFVAAPYFFYDLMLFHGTLLVDTDLSILNQILRDAPVNLTTLRREYGRALTIGEVKSSLIGWFEETLGVNFEGGEVSEYERGMAERLYEIKYGKDSWILDMKEPLTLKEVLVEVFIAYPPTSTCKSLIERVEHVTEDLQDRVEVKTWARGRGCPPGVRLTQGLKQASKESIIPAVIIDGELKFGREVPSERELGEAILDKLVKPSSSLQS